MSKILDGLKGLEKQRHGRTADGLESLVAIRDAEAHALTLAGTHERARRDAEQRHEADAAMLDALQRRHAAEALATRQARGRSEAEALAETVAAERAHAERLLEVATRARAEAEEKALADAKRREFAAAELAAAAAQRARREQEAEALARQRAASERRAAELASERMRDEQTAEAVALSRQAAERDEAWQGQRREMQESAARSAEAQRIQTVHEAASLTWNAPGPLPPVVSAAVPEPKTGRRFKGGVLIVSVALLLGFGGGYGAAIALKAGAPEGARAALRLDRDSDAVMHRLERIQRWKSEQGDARH